MAWAHDATSVGGFVAAGIATISWSHTIGSGTNRVLLVDTSVEDNSGTSPVVSSITYNGVALTKAISAIEPAEASDMSAETWRLLEASLPAAGTYTVLVTFDKAPASGGSMASASSYTGLAQAGPEATTAGNTAVDGTTRSDNITTVSANAMVHDVIGGGNLSTWTPDAGQTERCDQSGGSEAHATGDKAVAAAGSTALGWTASATQSRFAHALSAWAEVGTSTWGYPSVCFF